jgi:hypothetical protein
MSKSTRTGRRILEPEAISLGYRFDGLTAKGHLRWRNQYGRLVVTGNDMPDDRTVKNARGSLRRHACDGKEG